MCLRTRTITDPLASPCRSASALGGLGHAVILPRGLCCPTYCCIVPCARTRDVDASGSISKREFREALTAMGITARKAAFEKTFDTLDGDLSGSIDCKLPPYPSTPAHAWALPHRGPYVAAGSHSAQRPTAIDVLRCWHTSRSTRCDF